MPGEHLVQQHADGVEIGARVDLALGAQLLGRHVQRRAHDRAFFGEPLLDVVALLAHTRDAEVEELDRVAVPVARADIDVLGLEIAMDDAARVRRFEAAQHGARDEARARRRQLSLLELVGERVAREQLHDEIELPLGGTAEVGHADDVLVLDEAGGARLDGEALDGVGLGAHLGVQHLERDLLLQEHVIGDEDPAHAAFGEPAHHAVLAVDDRAFDELALHPMRDVITRRRGSRGWACRCR